jgi:hypothetical protein
MVKFHELDRWQGLSGAAHAQVRREAVNIRANF